MFTSDLSFGVSEGKSCPEETSLMEEEKSSLVEETDGDREAVVESVVVESVVVTVQGRYVI